MLKPVSHNKALEEIDWEVLLHPPYNSDFVSSRFLIFALLDSLGGQKFGKNQQVISCESSEKLLCKWVLSLYKNGKKVQCLRVII
jgi:hypothetical protein